MDNTNDIIDIVYIIAINLCLFLISIFVWNYLWIRNYGGILLFNIKGMIPIANLYSKDNELLYFQSKDVSFVTKEIFTRLGEFDSNYMVRSCGIEAFIYLLFQRKMINLIILMSLFSCLFSLISSIYVIYMDKNANFSTLIYNFFLNNKDLNSDFSTIFHIISCIVFTLLHFRFINIVKNEAKILYFNRFNNKSKTKDHEWLSARTLHVSGIRPHERNSKQLLN